MKVFTPHKKDRNIYFDEIINFSENEFVFGNFKDFDSSYEIVNIQFPEAIFDFKIPTQNELEELNLEIKKWKRNAKIVLILNDYKSHYDLENKFENLFELIYKYADAIVHLGKFSLETNENNFSETCKHTVIYHPLYESLHADFKTKNIEEKTALNFKAKYVVAVIGAIRSIEEVKLIFKVFKKIPNKNKLLFVPNMLPFWKLPPYLPYRIRKMYKRIMLFLYCFPLKKDQYFFGYNFIEYSYMIDLVRKSSLIIIPRLKNLNSGNLFLGLTFDKPMVIPKIGNLMEVAELFDLPTLDLSKNNYQETLKKVIDLDEKNFQSHHKYVETKKKFHPQQIALEYDLFFKELIND